MASAPLEEIFSALRDGKMVVMIAEEREDAEGDLVMAAEKITPDDINFMAREARGVISVAIPDKRFRELGIPLQPSTDNGDSNEQAGVLIDAREGATTGISASDRARVISVVAFDESRHGDIVMPGHILPLMALSGGVMVRIGRAEGAVDLMRSAGSKSGRGAMHDTARGRRGRAAQGTARVRGAAFYPDLLRQGTCFASPDE